jgi:hypothetical protein
MRTSRRITFAAALAAGVTMAGAAASFAGSGAGANLVPNGSFEQPSLASGSWGVFGSIDGWTGTGCGIEVQNGAVVPAHDGSQLVELDSYCSSGMYTDLATVPGWTYDVSYWYMPRPGVWDNAISSSWNGTDVDSVNGDGFSGTGWSQRSVTVKATQSSSRLGFQDRGPSDGVGGLLDDVSVTPDVSLSPLYDVAKSSKSGSTIPLKAQLVDANGNNISSAGVTLHAGAVRQVDGTSPALTDDAGQANSPSLDFRYDATLGGYIFNLSLKGYAPGTWTLPVTVSNGGGTFSLTFNVR